MNQKPMNPAGQRFPADERAARRAGALLVLLMAGCCVGGYLLGFSLLGNAVAVACLATSCFVAAGQVRHTRRNWLFIGERESTISIDGVEATIANAVVTKVWWTRISGGSAREEGATVVELWVGPHRHRLELLLGVRQAARAFRSAAETFTAAQWTYDTGLGVLVPAAQWGPGEPVPDLGLRARWSTSRRDPLARDPLAHRHRGHRGFGGRKAGRGGGSPAPWRRRRCRDRGGG